LKLRAIKLHFLHFYYLPSNSLSCAKRPWIIIVCLSSIQMLCSSWTTCYYWGCPSLDLVACRPFLHCSHDTQSLDWRSDLSITFKHY